MAYEMSFIKEVDSCKADEIITTQLTYLKVDPRHKYEKPYRVTYNTRGALPWTNASDEVKTASIKNFRLLQSSNNLDVFGFSVKTLQSSLSCHELEDSKSVKERFYPEVTRLLEQTFPEAAHIEIFDHGIRKRERDADDTKALMAPTNIVHIDYAAESIFKTSRAVCKAPAEKYPRVIMVNLWKSLQGPGNDWPLALCDRRTVDNMDLIDEDAVLVNTFSSHIRVYHRPEHEWYYVKDLQDDEIILFHQFDSAVQGGGGAPHASFDNPLATKGAAARRSIEVRAFIYFE